VGEDVMTKFAIVLALACCALLIGCGAILNGSNKIIDMQGSPTGATITSNPDIGEYTLPASLSLSRKHSYVLTFSREGYKDAKVYIRQNAQLGIIILDVLFTALVGVVVDAATGSWNNLSPDQVSVSLEKTTMGARGPNSISVSLVTRDGSDQSIEQLVLESDVPVCVRIEQQ
jgi:hypothetical protein